MSKAFIQKISLPFNPISITGCQLWLDGADAATVTGTSSVTAWTDKSGKGNNPTFSGTNPSYNSVTKVITTANANQQFTVPAASIQQSAGSGSLFLVYGDQQTGGGNSSGYNALWGTAGPGERFYQTLQAPTNSYAINGAFSPSGTVSAALATTNTLLYNMNYTYNSTTGDLRINGTTLSSSYQGTPVPSGALTLSGTGWGVVANVRLYEVISYKGATLLTTPQIQQIEGYLAQKWGLTANLPPGHPGLTQTIYTSNYNAKNPGIATAPSPAMTNVLYTNYYALSISGCALWLDAADPAGTGIAPANGSIISTWIDKSGTGNNGTSYGNPTFVTSAFNGKPSILFNGSTQRFLGAITNTGNTVSVFAIVSMNSGGQWGRICSLAVTNNFDGGVSSLYFIPLIRSSTNQSIQSGRYQGSGNVNVGPVAITYNVPFQAASIVNGTTNILYLNGTSAGSGSSTGNFGYTAYGIGAQPSDLQPEYFQGYISEIIIYNTALTTTQRQQIEGYLAWKWGLQSSLINTNPYYLAAPLSFGRPSQVAGIPLQIKMTGSYYWTVNYQPLLQAMAQANASATPSFTTVTVATGGSGGVTRGLVLGMNGNLFGIAMAYNGITTSISSFNPTTNTRIYSSVINGYPGPGALAQNGNVYFSDYGNTGALAIAVVNTNTATSTVDASNPVTGTRQGGVAYNPSFGAVCDRTGIMYLVPFFANAASNAMEVINTNTNSFTPPLAIPNFAESGFRSGVLGPDDNIYLAPGSAIGITVLNTRTKTSSVIGSPTQGGCTGGVLAPNGMIYMFPSGSNALMINPFTQTVTTLAATAGGGPGCLGPDGNIYCSGGYKINTTTNIITSTGLGFNGGMILHPNGNIYTDQGQQGNSNTFGGASVGVISFSGLSKLPNSNYCVSPYANKY